MSRRKSTPAVRAALADNLERRVMLSSYTPALLYAFPSSPTVLGIFTSGNGNLTYVDDSDIDTESGGAAPVLQAQFSIDGINDPNGRQFADSSGDIFGAANGGGTAEQPSGAVWEWKPGSNSITLLASFDPSTGGAQPSSDYMDASGNIYGTTNLGANGTLPGSIWEYHADTKQISFVPIPSSLGTISGDAIVADNSGNIFGATQGSASAPGVFFELPAGTTSFNTLATFSSAQQGNSGQLAIDSSNNIYGTTRSGTGAAEFYEVSAANRGTITALGVVPSAGGEILRDSSGNLFTLGLTLVGAATTEKFYELPAGQHTAQAIAILDNSTEGYDTFAFTIDPATGIIYGANQDGAANSSGALFSLTPGGSSGGSAGLSTTVGRSTLPASVVAGGTSHGSVTVNFTNTGSALDSGNFSARVYASADGLVDGSAVLIGTAAKKESLKAGAAASVTVAVKSLPATLDGTYTLLASVSDALGNSAMSSTGPTLTAAAPFIAFSDTIIQSTLAPSDVSGQKTKASVKLKIVNNGNIVSSGESTLAFYASTDGTVAGGTLIRSLTESIALKPNASKTITVPLLSIPAVANGSYELVAQVTDPKANLTTAMGGTYTLAAPFLSLVPSAAVVSVAKNGTASVRFTLANNGNIASSGSSTIAVLASTDGSAANATAVYMQPMKLTINPGKSRVVRLKLTATEVTTLQASQAVLLQVTDPLGGVQFLTLTGL